MRTTVLVQSPSHKCSVDFKVRGQLPDRAVKTVKGQPSVRLGSTWVPVALSEREGMPARLTVAREAQVPGMVRL